MMSLNTEFPWKTKLSSAGLIYFHFGHRIISNILNLHESDQKVKIIFKKVYENFLEAVDAVDNGISVCSCPPRYKFSTDLSSRVKMLNPKWDEMYLDPKECFEKATKLVGDEFMDKVFFYSGSWWSARTVVQNALEDRYNTYSTGEIIELKGGPCPWKKQLFRLEDELRILPEIKFVIYENEQGCYRVQSVPIKGKHFKVRLPLLKSWRGLQDDELCIKSGIQDCVFVHPSGCIGGNKTRVGAIKMAIDTLLLS